MTNSDWTLDTLKEHWERLREADQRAIDAAFEAQKEKGERHNDLINAMKDQQTTFVTKAALYSALGTIIAVLGLLVAYYATIGSK